jgi:uncharacterized damage-inducible protein DinB
MRKLTSSLSVPLLLAAVPFALRAQETAAPTSGIRAELISELNGVEKQLVDLAQAVPQEKYGWRPGQGVRSVSEVYVHVAGGNYMLPTFTGVKRPAGTERGMEKTVTEKAKVIETLKASFDHIRKAVLQTADADLDKKVDFFGRETTVRWLFVRAVNHAHEHLGQSIAYARVNGVVPPWSAAQERAPAKKPS